MLNADLTLARPTWGISFQRPNLEAGLPLRSLPVADKLIVPLGQNAGVASRPVVKVGDTVLKGQPVGEVPVGQLGANVHAPSSGNIIGLEPHRIPGGAEQPCVHIATDGLDTPWNGYEPAADPLQLSQRELTQRVIAGGIVGLGGAMFPAATKLQPGMPIDTLILNGVECEPRINCDDGLLRDRPEEILAGAQIMLKILAARRCLVALKADTAIAIERLRAALRDLNDDRFQLALVPPVYPAGGEAQLVQLLTGNEVPAAGLPRDIGCICQNVATAAAVARFISTGEPLVSRIVTVTGSGVAETMNIEARIGTPLKQLVAMAGGYTSDQVQLIMGGPMMGVPLIDDSIPVTKASNCFYVRDMQKKPAHRPTLPCINCGDCATVCPAFLTPQLMLQAMRVHDFDQLQQLGLPDCIECGCCDYVCPSNIDLTHNFIGAKQEQLLIEFDQQRAALAERRFSAHESRLLARRQAQQEQLDSAGADHTKQKDALRRLLERVGDDDTRGAE